MIVIIPPQPDDTKAPGRELKEEVSLAAAGTFEAHETVISEGQTKVIWLNAAFPENKNKKQIKAICL